MSVVPAAASTSEVPFLTMVSLRCEPGSQAARSFAKALNCELPGANKFVATGERHVAWIGPDEWLVIGPDGDDTLIPELEIALGDAFGVVADVSGQRTAIDIVGPKARDLIAHGCARDLDPRQAPAGTSFTTVFALTSVTLMVLGSGSTASASSAGSVSDAPHYRLLVRSSFTPYLVDWLADASTEYRADPAWQ